MSEADQRVYYEDPNGSQSWVPARGTAAGEQVMVDFYTRKMLDGKGFQLKAGTITTPLVGDVLITDTASEMAVDAVNASKAFMVVQMDISIQLNENLLRETALKGVAATPTAVGSTQVVLRPLRIVGSGEDISGLQGRVAAAGGVTVAAETVATTTRYWSDAVALGGGAGNDTGLVAISSHLWAPRLAPTVRGPGSVYLQIAAATTAPSYFATIDVIELATSELG